jgi:hypothetical protein
VRRSKMLKASGVNQEKIKMLKDLLAEAWNVSYELEKEAKENGNDNLVEIFAKTYIQINKLECDLKENMQKA